MSRQKRRRIGGYRPKSRLEFTVQQITVLEKGLACFKEGLERNKKPLPHLTFANTTFRAIMGKVAMMLAVPLEVNFDYNELLIISACLDMVMVDASFMAHPSDFTIAAKLNEQIKALLQASAVSPKPIVD